MSILLLKISLYFILFINIPSVFSKSENTNQTSDLFQIQEIKDITEYDFLKQLVKGGFNITTSFFQTPELENFDPIVCLEKKDLTQEELVNCDSIYQDFLEKSIVQFRLCSIYRRRTPLYPCQRLVKNKINLNERDLFVEIIRRSIIPFYDRYNNILNSFRERQRAVQREIIKKNE